MSIGKSPCSIKINRPRRLATIVGNNWSSQELDLTLTGHSPTDAPKIAILVYRGNTLVATAGALAGTTSSATGKLDMFTTPAESVFASVPKGEIRSFSLRIWDAVSTLELIGTGDLAILSSGSQYPGSTPVPPIPPSTLKIGIFAFYNGLTYGLNSSDGLYYPISFSGAGEQIHWHYDEAGISIP